MSMINSSFSLSSFHIPAGRLKPFDGLRETVWPQSTPESPDELWMVLLCASLKSLETRFEKSQMGLKWCWGLYPEWHPGISDRKCSRADKSRQQWRPDKSCTIWEALATKLPHITERWWAAKKTSAVLTDTVLPSEQYQ